jgi:hypothetical protein
MADNTTSVKITANASQFESEMRRVATLANSTGTSLTNAFKGAGLALAGIGSGLALSTLKEKFDSIIASTSNLKEMSDKTGASVENLSGLGAVAKVTATDMGLVTAAMNKLSKGLHASDDDAKGTGKALEFLGLKLNDLRGKDSAENLKIVADKMADLEDGTGKVALAMALFGKNGAEMLAFMKDLAQSGDLVVKTTEAQAIAAKNYEEDLRRLTATKEALYKTVTLELAPAFDTFVRALIGAKNETNGMIQVGKDLAADGSIREWGIQATQVAGFVIDAFDGVARVIKGVGITFGAAAAQIGALANGSLSQFNGVAKAYREDMDALANKPMFSQKLQVQTDALRAHWAQVEAVKKAYASFPKDVQNKALKALEASFYGSEGGTKSAAGFTAAPDPRNAKGSGSTKIDDYTRTIQMLNEKITVEQAAIDSVGKLTQAEKEYAKYQADVASGAIKMTGAQKSIADAYWEVYRARAQQKEFDAGVEKQVEATRQQTVALNDRIQALKTEADTTGLTEAAIAAMTASRLEEAIALASSRGATADQIAVLEEELAIRNKLSSAIESRDLARDLSMTKSAQAARDEAKRAAYDRALANKEISEQQHQELLDTMSKDGDAMGEFAKKAAQNMQDAMANFFIDPTQKGMKSIAQSFGEMVQKMIAQAAAAQLGKLLFGDMDKTGNLGGWLGKIFGASSTSSASSALDFSSIFDTGLFANGGIMTSAGRLPLNTYAGGGVANRPQLALFGEGRTPEAYVPLPDGRRIPVAMQGGNSGMNITQNITVGANADKAEVRRAAATGARSVLGLMAGSQRYS